MEVKNAVSMSVLAAGTHASLCNHAGCLVPNTGIACICSFYYSEHVSASLTTPSSYFMEGRHLDQVSIGVEALEGRLVKRSDG